jgi:hypothetical protein
LLRVPSSALLHVDVAAFLSSFLPVPDHLLFSSSSSFCR